MKRLGDLKKAGLIEEINIQTNFIGPAREIIDALSENKIIGLIQYQLATRSIDQLFVDYPLIKGYNPHILIAFAVIYTTNKLSLNDVAKLFYDLDLKLGRERADRDKTWYYQHSTNDQHQPDYQSTRTEMQQSLVFWTPPFIS